MGKTRKEGRGQNGERTKRMGDREGEKQKKTNSRIKKNR
jgi:hypothetical protein